MSLLQMLCEADGPTEVGSFASLLVLLGCHVEEGLVVKSAAVLAKLQPQPPKAPTATTATAPVAAGPPPQPPSALPQAAPVLSGPVPPPQAAKQSTRPSPSPLQSEAVLGVGLAVGEEARGAPLAVGEGSISRLAVGEEAGAPPPSSVPRRIGGVAPPSPYTPFTNARRPASCSTVSRVLPQRTDAAAVGPTPPTTAAATAASDGPSEFVDRWLEKLYFRNPVVVRRHSSASVQRGGSPPDSMSASPPQAPQFTNENAAVATTPYGHPNLPPKPICSRPGNRADQIRHEVVQERLVNAFAGGPSQPYGAAATGVASSAALQQTMGSASSSVKVNSRPPSPLAHGFCLPSSSKFVDTKKHAAQAMALSHSTPIPSVESAVV